MTKFLVICCLLGLWIIPAKPSSITRNLLEDLKEFRKKFGDMPDELFDLELAVNNLVLAGRDNITDPEDVTVELEEEVKLFRKKLAGLPDELFDLELDLNNFLNGRNITKAPDCGEWYLGMNLNPGDGHIMDFTTGWASDHAIGSDETALSEDYLNRHVWRRPANYIAIVRHQDGEVEAVKVFELKQWGSSLSNWFKDMNPGRMIVSEGGPIQESVASGARNLDDDPIFSLDGDLAFNWAYSNNGARIVMTGGYLSGAAVNDDRTRGLGNHFLCDPLTGTSNNPEWGHEISNAQACRETCTFAECQGTDHGSGGTLHSGPVYGFYAIYVSQDAKTFPEPGSQLDLKLTQCK